MKLTRFLGFLSLTATSGLLFASLGAQAQERFDPPYNHPRRPFVVRGMSGPFDVRPDGLPSASSTAQTIRTQSSVKNQAARGSCSIFSALGFVEYFLMKNGVANPDLSEEYLQYLMSIRHSGASGSSTPANFQWIPTRGVATEAELPYIGETWATAQYSTLSQQRCGTLADLPLAMCLTGHRDPALLNQTDETLLLAGGPYYDPQFQTARASARQFVTGYGSRIGRARYMFDETAIKTLLSQGIPVFLDIDVYYGAWNHRKADTLRTAPEAGGHTIGRSLQAWSAGEVGYPEVDSLDYVLTQQEPAGHSVLIVGYDDQRVITTNYKLADGTYKTETYTGVYYFKNSWGTFSFGSQFKIGEEIFPGYGAITQKYAHEYGSFFEIPVQ